MEYSQLFAEIRQCNKCLGDKRCINVPHPGLFLGNKILFVGQNPGKPNPQLNPSDEALLTPGISDEAFHEAYKASQLNWHFYKKFIVKFMGDSMDFSIINVVRCPINNNDFPSIFMSNNCRGYIKRSIEIINPRNIIVLGRIARDEVHALKVDEKYNVIYTYHYSWLLRQRESYSQQEIDRVKELIRE